MNRRALAKLTGRSGAPWNAGAADNILPRHFLQTADLAGVGNPLMRAIFEDLAANAEKQAEIVINALPRGLPDQLVSSVHGAVKSRSALLASTSKEAADA